METGTMEFWGCNSSVKTILPLTTCLVVLGVKRSLGLYAMLLMVFLVLRVRKGINKSSCAGKI